MTPKRFHRLATWTLFFNALIVLTGAGVRLTESGLGCADWPNCEEGSLAPAELDLLGWIEFGNRLLSGVVGLICVAALWGAIRRRPRVRRLVALAAGLVVGSVAQIILGAFIIALELDPIAVGGHFLISAVMLMVAVLLWTASMPDLAPDDDRPWWSPFDLRSVAGDVSSAGNNRRHQTIRRHGRLLCALAALVVFAGVVVTGTGPNSGDSRATRLPFEFETVARLHGITVWVFLAVLVALAVRLHKAQLHKTRLHNAPDGTGPSDRLSGLVRWLMALTVAQGALGYGQYLAGVPPLLVELHILGAITVWMMTVVVWTGTERLARPAVDEPGLRDIPGGVVEHVQPVQ